MATISHRKSVPVLRGLPTLNGEILVRLNISNVDLRGDIIIATPSAEYVTGRALPSVDRLSALNSKHE